MTVSMPLSVKFTEGIEVVDEIAETPTDMQDKPIEDQIIKTIRLV